MSQHPELDQQPEQDIPPAELASLSLGLVLGAGLILGTLIGGLVGHFIFDDAFGWGQDILVGAIFGAVIGAVLSVGGVKLFTSEVRHHNDRS